MEVEVHNFAVLEPEAEVFHLLRLVGRPFHALGVCQHNALGVAVAKSDELRLCVVEGHSEVVERNGDMREYVLEFFDIADNACDVVGLECE